MDLRKCSILFGFIGIVQCLGEGYLQIRTEDGMTEIAIANRQKIVIAPNPLLGSNTQILTSLDQEMEWQIDPELKLYQEKSILDGRSNLTKSPERKIMIEKLSGKQQIAGLETESYRLVLPEQRILVLWIVPPHPQLSELQKEIVEYQTAYLSKACSMDSHSQELSDPTFLILSFIHEESFRLLRGARNFPKGFPAKLEKEGLHKTSGETLFVLERFDLKVPPTIGFGRPQGFRNVRSLMEEQIRQMKGD